VVAVTGASAGVGRATARAFARRGAAVALIARGQERLELAKREVTKHRLALLAGASALALAAGRRDND
jgi:NADP-dependent 3-hydroxy acid dehydrogenase YdfG